MSKVLVTESSLAGIAAAIREKNGSSDTYNPGQMAAAVQAIPTGITPTGTVNITQNGTVDVTDYASAAVAVPNTYAAGDEGKVVSNGALVAQTSRTIGENGTYDTTTNDEVTVNVSGGGGGGATILSGTSMPTASQGSNGDLYLRYAGASIKNSAGQYINTGYSGNENSEYNIYFRLTKAQTSEWPTPFGGRQSVGSAAGGAYLSLSKGIRDYGGSVMNWNGNQTYFNSAGATSLIDKICQIILKNGSLIVYADDQEVINETFTQSGAFSSTQIGIFSMLAGNALQSWAVCDGMELYSFSISEGQTLVHNYIPALDDNDTPCVYDTVQQEYLYNSGTGDFVYASSGDILSAYVKVSGAWQNLIGSDISDVGGVSA